MAEESGWQPNYVDLSDDRVVRFGGACRICQAQYATVPEPLRVTPPIEGDPDPATAQAIEEQKYQLFTAFDAAFRSISIRCYRCGDLACPECWDQDKQMCGRCVAQRGLTRSPHRGGPVDGPLAAGFLRRVEPGRYSEVSRPAWLKDLLRSQSDPDAARAANLTSPPVSSGAPAPSMAPPPGSMAPPPPPPIDLMPARAPAPAAVPEPVVPLPTETPPSAGVAASAPPLISPLSNSPRGSIGNQEGESQAGFVECPRCHTLNYDFVTQCSECGLQLIQVCPTCDMLNPGHAQQCQHCGASLARPKGWSGVMSPIVPVAPEQARRRMTDRPVRPATPPPAAPPPPVWGAADTPIGHAERGAAMGAAKSSPRRAAVMTDPDPRAASDPFSSSGTGLAAHAYGAAAFPAAPLPPSDPPPHYMSSDPALQAVVPMTARHPYEDSGPALFPLIAEDSSHAGPSRRALLLGALWSLVEHTFTIAVWVAVFAVVGAITAAEASPQANSAIYHVIHVDIKAQIKHLLYLLHLTGQLWPGHFFG